jgi:hypothetical protein
MQLQPVGVCRRQGRSSSGCTSTRRPGPGAGPARRGRQLLPKHRPSAGQNGVLAGLAWWALSAGKADEALVCATEATQFASASGDPVIQRLADTALAAVRTLGDPSGLNIETFLALAQQAAQGLPYRSYITLTDRADVAALAARLALPSRSAATRRRPPLAGSTPS